MAMFINKLEVMKTLLHLCMWRIHKLKKNGEKSFMCFIGFNQIFWTYRSIFPIVEIRRWREEILYYSCI